jgi:hypothetical protein
VGEFSLNIGLPCGESKRTGRTVDVRQRNHLSNTSGVITEMAAGFPGYPCADKLWYRGRRCLEFAKLGGEAAVTRAPRIDLFIQV